MNTIVNFVLAKKLKECGYDNDDCKMIYYGDFEDGFEPEIIEPSDRNTRYSSVGEFEYLAPTISDVVMWIYNTYNIWISVNMFDYNNKVVFEYILLKNKLTYVNYLNKNAVYNTPQEAYLAAIEDVLTTDYETWLYNIK